MKRQKIILNVCLLVELFVSNNKTQKGFYYTTSFLTETHSMYLIIYLPELSQSCWPSCPHLLCMLHSCFLAASYTNNICFALGRSISNNLSCKPSCGLLHNLMFGWCSLTDWCMILLDTGWTIHSWQNLRPFPFLVQLIYWWITKSPFCWLSVFESTTSPVAFLAYSCSTCR